MQDTYKGGNGAGKQVGPSMAMKDAARKGGLAMMFFQAFLLAINDYITMRTNCYAHKDYVVETPRLDREDNVTRKPILKQIFPDDTTKLPPGARHRYIPRDRRTLHATTNYIIAWFGVLILCDAFFRGDSNRGLKCIYGTGAYRLDVPVIQNTMPRNSFTFLRQYIHFSIGSEQKPQGDPKYDPLFKVRFIIDVLMASIKACRNAGDRVAIDESMIRYRGRAVSFIQYMPRKPIKHGLKVFAICCAYSSVLLGFEVYCGAEQHNDDKSARSALAVVERLIRLAGLGKNKGTTLYTDNWYRTVALAVWLFVNLGWFFNGTFSTSKKVSRCDDDVPFHTLSNGAPATVE